MLHPELWEREEKLGISIVWKQKPPFLKEILYKSGFPYIQWRSPRATKHCVLKVRRVPHRRAMRQKRWVHHLFIYRFPQTLSALRSLSFSMGFPKEKRIKTVEKESDRSALGTAPLSPPTTRFRRPGACVDKYRFL